MSNIQLKRGDITTASVDAIINAANPQMLGGGGVDGAIHAAAGPALLDACRAVKAVGDVRCPIGEARITTAGNLGAKYVIHTVGPRYHIDPHPADLLAAAYRNSYRLAIEHHCATLAVPAISCGVYAYPLDEAARIALTISADPEFSNLNISFFLFGNPVYDAFSTHLQ